MSKRKKHDFHWDEVDSELTARFTSYLKTSLLNERAKYLDKLKNRQKRELSYEEMADHGQLPAQYAEDLIENVLMWETLKNYLIHLTPRERQVIACLYFLRLTPLETAARLHMNVKTVSYHKRKALEKVGKILEV